MQEKLASIDPEVLLDVVGGKKNEKLSDALGKVENFIGTAAKNAGGPKVGPIVGATPIMPVILNAGSSLGDNRVGKA